MKRCPIVCRVCYCSCRKSGCGDITLLKVLRTRNRKVSTFRGPQKWADGAQGWRTAAGSAFLRLFTFEPCDCLPNDERTTWRTGLRHSAVLRCGRSREPGRRGQTRARRRQGRGGAGRRGPPVPGARVHDAIRAGGTWRVPLTGIFKRTLSESMDSLRVRGGW